MEFVYFAALQEDIFNAGRAIIEVRDPAPSQQVSSSYVLEWMETTFSTVFAFILHGCSSTYVQMLELVESDDFHGVRKFKNSPQVTAHPS